MLMLLFSIGANRYALAARDVIEVIPLVKFRSLPKAPPGVAGVFNYRGLVAPAVDMRRALEGVASQSLFSTRILIVNAAKDGEPQPLGLIVECASDAVDLPENEAQSAGVSTSDAPYLKEIHHHDGEMVQRIDPFLLLPESVRNSLFRDIQENEVL
ncbi:MAG: chemotaxis protein CheW [Candidatus Hinthialibacter antarcticus]|nr:chemotaxis protein CheW [Candidatus Hinthialibacter antarcticus]